MRKDWSGLKTTVPTEELKEKIVQLNLIAYEGASMKDIVLEKINNVHPKKLRRVCQTEYKYICISKSKSDNTLTFFASVSRQEFRWWCSFSTINEAIIAVKKKFAEHNMFVGSIKRKK
jgi:hypothetical protein